MEKVHSFCLSTLVPQCWYKNNMQVIIGLKRKGTEFKSFSHVKRKRISKFGRVFLPFIACFLVANNIAENKYVCFF